MLFHVTLDHTPELCPIVTSGSNPMPQVIARAGDTGVNVVSVFGAKPQHCVYLVLEIDDVAKLNDFLDPVLGWAKCDITPVASMI